MLILKPPLIDGISLYPIILFENVQNILMLRLLLFHNSVMTNKYVICITFPYSEPLNEVYLNIFLSDLTPVSSGHENILSGHFIQVYKYMLYLICGHLCGLK